jgi:hypothetical protein
VTRIAASADVFVSAERSGDGGRSVPRELNLVRGSILYGKAK